jgi:hypothetical protein
MRIGFIRNDNAYKSAWLVDDAGKNWSILANQKAF